MAFRYKRVFGRPDSTAYLHPWPVATNQTITEGMALILSSGLAAKATAGSTAILGVAAHDKTTGASVTSADTVLVYLDPNAEFEVGYTGSTKTSLSDADLGTAFDINTDAISINLDDTTGGMCVVVGYDNTAKTARVKFKSASRALA